jgi:hypothetical protein
VIITQVFHRQGHFLHRTVHNPLIIMERYPDTGITFVSDNVDALVTPEVFMEKKFASFTA